MENMLGNTAIIDTFFANPILSFPSVSTHLNAIGYLVMLSGFDSLLEHSTFWFSCLSTTLGDIEDINLMELPFEIVSKFKLLLDFSAIELCFKLVVYMVLGICVDESVNSLLFELVHDI